MVIGPKKRIRVIECPRFMRLRCAKGRWLLGEIPQDEKSSIASFRWTVALGYVALAGSLCLVRYHLFIATGWDLGFYEQGLWNLASHGPSALSSWGGYPVLARNAAWILWPLAYPYRILGVGFLLVLQAFAYGVGFYFLFDIAAEQGLSWDRVRVLGWIYLLSPLAWGATLFDFHPSLLAIPLILAAYGSVIHRRHKAASLWFILALATHVLVSVVGALSGLVIITRGRFGVGAVVLLGSITVLTLDAVLLHRLDPGAWLPIVTYWGTHGGRWSQDLVAGLERLRTWLYLAWVLVPILLFGATRRALVWYLPVAGILVLNVSSTSLAPTSPFNQYSALTIPFLMLACVESLRGAQGPLPFRTIRIAAYLSFFLVFFGHEATLRHEIVPSTQAVALSTAVDRIPFNVQLFTQNFFAPHVANRSDLQLVASGQTFPSNSYVVLDSTHSSGVTNSAVINGDIQLLLKKAIVVYSKSGVYVFRLSDAVKGVVGS